ncbi:MAG TPA: S-layer homology domain-containing protein [Chthonomonadales bacterium]|nr:S-layer homology domain-containing protein [Chthonomonadales bacterium]
MHTFLRITAFLIVAAGQQPSALAGDGPRPADVRAGHWAAPYVQEVLDNKVMALPDGRNFRGEAPVSRIQALDSFVKLARLLEAGRWRGGQPVTVSPKQLRTVATAKQLQGSRVTRYSLAAVLARMADYFSRGNMRPPAGSTDLGKSVAIPPAAAIKLSKQNPRYQQVRYLVSRREAWGDSPFLQPDTRPINGSELGLAMDELIIGLNDRLTQLGHDANGSTIDTQLRARDNARHKLKH